MPVRVIEEGVVVKLSSLSTSTVPITNFKGTRIRANITSKKYIIMCEVEDGVDMTFIGDNGKSFIVFVIEFKTTVSARRKIASG